MIKSVIEVLRYKPNAPITVKYDPAISNTNSMIKDSIDFILLPFYILDSVV